MYISYNWSDGFWYNRSDVLWALKSTLKSVGQKSVSQYINRKFNLSVRRLSVRRGDTICSTEAFKTRTRKNLVKLNMYMEAPMKPNMFLSLRGEENLRGEGRDAKRRSRGRRSFQILSRLPPTMERKRRKTTLKEVVSATRPPFA